jgi:hypothetical protein
MREEGFAKWSRSVVAAIENGNRRVSVEELVGLSIVFATPLGEFVASGRDRWLTISEEGAVKSHALVDVFSGANPLDLPATSFDSPRRKREVAALRRAVEMTARVARRASKQLPDVSAFSWGEVWEIDSASKGELERHIARRVRPHDDVGDAAFDVATAAFRLWGHSATEERDLRALDRPEAKQHISREIVREISEALAPRREGRKR